MIKPSSEQGCNTHACIETRCCTNNSYVETKYTSQAADAGYWNQCTNSILVLWEGNKLYSDYESCLCHSCYGVTINSLNHNGYKYTMNYNRNNICPGYSSSCWDNCIIRYCLTRAPI